MKKKTYSAAMAALFFMLPSQAFADCDDIADNEAWIRNLIDVAAYHDHGDHAQSLEIGLKMLSMCDRSPALNYYSASNYQALGDNTKALEYILKASDGTAHMATSKENEDSIKRKRKELETIVVGETTANIKFKDEYKALMWTGFGVASGGVVLTVIGAILAVPPTNKEVCNKSEIKDLCVNYVEDYLKKTNLDHPYTPTNLAGYALLGSGLSMLIGGSILGGIYCYKYTHFEDDNAQFSFQLALTSAGLRVTF